MYVAAFASHALCCANNNKRSKKIRYVNQCAESPDIILLQEVHEDKEYFDVVLCNITKEFNLFHSSCANLTAGGVAILIRKSTFGLASFEAMHEFVRRNVVRICHGDVQNTTLNKCRGFEGCGAKR